jgi:hypothetical protein
VFGVAEPVTCGSGRSIGDALVVLGAESVSDLSLVLLLLLDAPLERLRTGIASESADMVSSSAGFDFSDELALAVVLEELLELLLELPAFAVVEDLGLLVVLEVFFAESAEDFVLLLAVLLADSLLLLLLAVLDVEELAVFFVLSDLAEPDFAFSASALELLVLLEEPLRTGSAASSAVAEYERLLQSITKTRQVNATSVPCLSQRTIK